MASPSTMQPSAANNNAEPFPGIDTDVPRSPASDATPPRRTQTRATASSSLSGRLRRVSQSFGQSELPEGFSAATGGIASSILSGKTKPTLVAATPTRGPPSPPEKTQQENNGSASAPSTASKAAEEPPPAAAPFANGYHFPPAKSFAQSTKLGALAFWQYFTTPVGFLVTIYGLNIVAWGGMLFLLLCNASPAMCYPSCNDINSPRRKWIEWDSQILNALFCVTGFGLAPWRFRDLYFLLQYRIMKNCTGLRRLAGIHRDWFRLPGSKDLSVDLGPQNVSHRLDDVTIASVPYPETKMSDPPLTGVRAPSSKVWKLDLVIWLMVWNTFLQACLSGFMWGMNRYDRPSWSTGLFVALACVVAAIGGFIMFLEGKAVKGIEGVPLTAEDMERLEKDREQGIYHYNNIKDRDLDAKKAKGKE